MDPDTRNHLPSDTHATAGYAGSATAPTAILVHGLWTPAAVLTLQAYRLRRQGYGVRCFGYPSVRATLSDNAQALHRVIAATTATTIHLVGHSLGGLLILDLLAKSPDPRLHRVVLLGTPSLGSHCARQLTKVTGMSIVLGRSIGEWLSRPPGALAWQRTGVEIGVIAGSRSFGLGRVVPGLPQPNDGVVTLAEARLPGATDFLVLRVAHSQLLTSSRCAQQIATFLRKGCFDHEVAP